MNDNSNEIFGLLTQFDQLFPSDAACLNELSRLKGDLAKHCGFCNNFNLECESGSRRLICPTCKKTNWVTAGTFFNRVRRLRSWFAAIWLIERGASFNSMCLSSHFGVSTSTAQCIIKKVSVVIEEKIAANSQKVPSANFLDVFCRRSTLTPAAKHPRFEQLEYELSRQEIFTPSAHGTQDEGLTQKQPSELLSKTDGSKMVQPTTLTQSETTEGIDVAVMDPNISEKILNLLSDKPIQFEQLRNKLDLTVSQMAVYSVMLELDGLVIRQPGGCLIKTRAVNEGVLSAVEKSKIDSAINFVRSTFAGISRKYLQTYISLYSRWADREKFQEGELLESCLRFRAVTQSEIRLRVAPLYVMLAA